MIKFLSKKVVLVWSWISISLMFVLVMFYVNPLIDGADGSGLLMLQLSFDKRAGIEIINDWGESGLIHFNRLFFMDYIYAVTYSIFLASIISFIIIRKGKEKVLIYRLGVYFPFSAGILDCVENTMEIYFIKDPFNFSNELFFLHSVFAVVKWLSVFISFVFIIVLCFTRNASFENNQ